jgi:hypothetical protein
LKKRKKKKKKMSERTNMLQYTIGILLVIFILSDISTVPDVLNNTMGKMGILALTVGMLLYAKPVIGVLMLIVCFKLFYSEETSSLVAWTPPSRDAWSAFAEQNQFDKTLEEEMVQQMTSSDNNQSVTYIKSPYRPISGNTHGAQYLYGNSS